MTPPRAVLRGNSDRMTFDIGRYNAAGGPGPCGDITFRQKPSARERAKCSTWAKCLGMPGDCDQARRCTSRTKRSGSQAAFAAPLFHHHLYPIPRLQPVLVAEAVKHAEP